MERLCFVLAFLPGFLFLFQPSFSAVLLKCVAFILVLIGFFSYFRTEEKLEWKPLPIWFWIFPLSLFVFGFANHAFHLTKTLILNFSIWDLDYIGLRVLIKNIATGESFASPYYEGGNSYLFHHFAPGIALLSPFEFLPYGQFNYAIGVFTVFIAGIIGWAILFIKERRFVGLLILLHSIYLYRLGVSYHFEVLVLPFSLFFFYFWFYKREGGIVLKMLSLLCFLSIKEDIALYLLVLGVFLALFEKDRLREAKALLFSTVLYTVIAQGTLHFLSGNSSLEFWISEWNKDYSETISNPLDWEKRKNIIVDVSLGFGLFFFRKNAFVFSVYALLCLHLISDRPWYNEVYSYYSYTILPFAFMAIFENEKVSSKYMYLLIFLGLAFYRNSLDRDFPMRVVEDSMPSLPIWQETMDSPVFCQQNISIFASSKMNLHPLTKLGCNSRGIGFAMLSRDVPPLPIVNREGIEELAKKIEESGGKVVQKQFFLGKQMNLYQLKCP